MIDDLAQQRGKLEEAVRDFQETADTTARLLKSHPDDPQRIFDQSQSEYWVGYVQWYRGHLHEAEAAFRRYLDMAQRMNKVKPGDHDWQLEDVFAKTNVGIVLTDLGRAEEALPLLTDARNEIAQLVRTHPEDAEREGNIIGWSVIAYAALGRDEEAIRADDDKIVAALRAPNADTDRDVQFLVANAHHEIAALECNLGRCNDALALVRRALTELQALSARDPTNAEDISEIVGSQALLAEMLADIGDREHARTQLQEASKQLAMLKARPVPKRVWRLSYTARLAELQGRLADSEDERHAATTALAAFMADVRLYEAQGGVVPRLDAIAIANAGVTQGDLLAAAGRTAQAREAWESAAERIRPIAERLNPAAMTQLGQLDFRLGNIQDARAWTDKVLGTTYRHPAFADLQKRLGPTQLAGGAARP